MSQETVISVVELVGTVVILWIGFAMVLQSQISIGSLFTFYALLSYFITPVKNLIDLQPAIQKAYVAVDRLNDIVLLDKEKNEGENKGFDDEISSIEFRNVSHRYGNRELTLNNVSFSIRKGEKIAIIGVSGSGKTTLAKLLLRLYEVETGDIFINGNSIRKYSLDALRKKIGYVSQNVFLMSDSIKNNIKLTNSNATDDDVIFVSKKSCADDFIKNLPFGYETVLEENGMNLSGGQRQKIAIARMLLSKPEVIILDEATSNLDVYSENIIKNNLMESNETVIVITHKLKNVKLCDKIVLIENGFITEMGSHEELIKKNGRYAQMLEEG